MPEDDPPVPPIVVKKYANRRLYDTESSIYITLETLADMVRHGRDFVVYDAKTGDDITRAVLTQIIMEEETRGRNMLPTSFLRQLISFYGDSAQGLVPDYLERMMEQFAAQQHQVREPAVQAPSPSGVEEAGRQNLTIRDRAMSLFSPFHRPGPEPRHTADHTATQPSTAPPEPIHTAAGPEEATAMREEILRLREELARVTAILGEPTADARAIRGGGIRH